MKSSLHDTCLKSLSSLLEALSDQKASLYTRLFPTPTSFSLTSLASLAVPSPFGTLQSLLLFAPSSDPFFSFHLLNALRCCSLVVSRSSLETTLVSTLFSTFIQSPPSLRITLLQHYLLLASVADSTTRHCVASLLATIVQSVSFHYHSLLSLDDRLLAFLVDCDSLLITAQLHASTDPPAILTLSSITGAVLATRPIDSQNTFIHTLLTSWKNADSLCSQAHGILLSQLSWRLLKCLSFTPFTPSQEMAAKKLPALFSLLQTKLASRSPYDCWAVTRLCEQLAGKQPQLAKPLFVTVMTRLNESMDAFSRLTLMKLSQILIPVGMQPQQLRPYLERIVALEGEERTDEFCIVVAQIMEVACNVMFPKKDLEAISSCYGCLLRWVLKSGTTVRALCLKSIVRFMVLWV